MARKYLPLSAPPPRSRPTNHRWGSVVLVLQLASSDSSNLPDGVSTGKFSSSVLVAVFLKRPIYPPSGPSNLASRCDYPWASLVLTSLNRTVVSLTL